MRIGLFTDTYTPDINGVVSSIITLQNELEKNGHDVYIITNHKAMTRKREGNILRLPGLELKWLYGYKLSTPYHFSARDEIKKMKLDVIHVHTEFGVGMFGRIVAKYLYVPVVTTYHTMYEDYTHYINKFDIDEVEKATRKVVGTFSRALGDHAQAVISPSEKTKETLLNYGVTTPIYVVPTGLNFNIFNKASIQVDDVKNIRKQYGIQDTDKLVVYVGRVAPEKSIDIPIQGFRYIEDPSIKFMIVGGGPSLQDLKAMVKTYAFEDRVVFTDKKQPEEIPSYYACANCFVSASLTETQGMTYIEAMACGLPVFARYDDVLEDLVIEGDSGFFFETPQEFAKKLIQFMGLAQAQKDAFRERAQAKVTKYDANVFYSKIITVYYQAIDDFEYAYEVTKIKTLDDYVRIFVENSKEDQPIKILIDLEDYFSFKIRLHTMLDRHTIAIFQRKERILEAYRSSIRKLRARDYTRKEMEHYLSAIGGLEKTDREKILHELEEKGYLNDQLYLAEKMEKLHLSLTGKQYIRRTLVNKGLNIADVDAALAAYDDDEEKLKASKLAEKLMTTIKDKSNAMKKQTIIQKLISFGFDSDIARHTGEKLRLEEDESDALEKTVQKALRNYNKRWKGQHLRQKVCAYCMQKGFVYEDITTKLDEMEWQDEC